MVNESVFADPAKRAIGVPLQSEANGATIRLRGHGFSRRDDAQQPLGEFSPTGKFGRMFPQLRPLTPDPAALKELADAMLDVSPDEPTGDNPGVPAGYTYLGQFIDHDLTFDPTSLQEVLVDPLSLRNFRTPMLDLDNVYGTGPAAQPQIYQRTDSDLFLIGKTSLNPGGGDPTVPPGLPHDLPRSPEGFALIGDPRNDENLIVAQLHQAFLKFHNQIVLGLRNGSIPRTSPIRKTIFDEARDLAIWHYQWIVLHDFLNRLLDQDVLRSVLNNGPTFYVLADGDDAFMPVEFSGAAYRLGHSMVRQIYDYNRVFTPLPGGVTPATFNLLFRFTGLSGDGTSVPIPSDWIIDWRRFFIVGTGARAQLSRRLDPFTASELHKIPAGPGKTFSLPERNLLRGRSLGLPPGQSIARLMGYASLTPQEISQGSDGAIAAKHNLHIESPLWYYILKEAEIQNQGERLGQVGSRIVAEVFVGLLEADASSFLARNQQWRPTLPARRPGTFTMADLLTFVGELNPLGDNPKP